MNNPVSVWGLDTGRAGEFTQIATLATALGLTFERIRLSPQSEPPETLPAEPPRLILSFGRAARAALRLAAACNRRALLVHLGTPGKTPITAFDLIIPMPQDDYPPAPNVLFLRLPLNGASADVLAIPPPGSGKVCTVIVGGPSRHFRITKRAIRQLVRSGALLAAANRETFRVVTSPRTSPPILAELRRLSVERRFTLHEYGATPFAAILQTASRLIVTADSASMLAEACRTGAPVWLFPLPTRPNLSDFLQHAADRCLGPNFRHRLVRRGLVGGGTDFYRWHCRLEQCNYVVTMRPLPEAALRWSPAAARPDTDLRDCRDRILGLLAGHINPMGAGTADGGANKDFHRLRSE